MSLLPLPTETRLAAYSHLRVGGTAEAIYAPASVEELQTLLPALDPARTIIVGGGSNLLFPEHTDHVILLDRNMPSAVRIMGGLASVDAACPVNRLIARALDAGLGGLDFVAGLPAHLGGLITMNAGAWGHRIGEFVRTVTVVDWNGRLQVLDAGDIEFGYRHTSISGFIVEAELALEAGDPADIRRRLDEALALRRERHPMDAPSLGCFFKNPPGESAGRLIDACGLKGLRIGGAEVSTRHANFIINADNATYEHMLGVARRVRDAVAARTGVQLEPEVRIVPQEGEDPWK